ncbi:MAG: SDR family NAD(P)-dependent oxidoreductase [Spirochaetaceae bacterium]|nr:MAG: SDR family NAD(P)-dependent oxidoreductase [Spirochaetaceae bacterium]
MERLAGKTAIVTGGARGIGLATARCLLREGVILTLWDVDADALGAARDLLLREHPGAEVQIVPCDITDAAAVTRATAFAETAMGRIDILVNNAGYLAPGNLLDQPAQQWDRTVSVNLNGLIYTTQAVLPGMYDRNCGHVVNISSAAATLGVAGLAVYTATKWAVWGFTESLRQETINLGYGGVRFSSIHPIFLREGMFAGARLRGPGALLVPNVRDHEVIGRAVVDWALKRGRRVVMRPRTVRLAVLLRGILPNRLFEKLVRILGVSHGMSGWHGDRGGRTD